MIPLGVPSERADLQFIRISVSKLRDDFLPRLVKAVEHLPESDVWQRSGAQSNSVGNILLHMSGNLRQWVVGGIGGEADTRVRQEEFSTRGGRSKRELVEELTHTVLQAVEVLERCDSRDLPRVRHVQAYEVSGIEAVYHAVEHFSYHLGQVIFAVKEKQGIDLKFYNL